MKFPLSKGARILLIRIFFFVIALGSVYSVYDNREFLAIFPFYITAIFDILFALFFLYAAVLLPRLMHLKKTSVFRTFLIFWTYAIILSLGSFTLYVYNLGVEKVTAISEHSFALYIFYEVAYLAILPSLVFGLIAWIIHKTN